MLDRDQLLASDHEARLHAEAAARRLAAVARTAAPATGARASSPTQTRPRLRTRLGAWLVASGRELAAEPDPCGPPKPRTAQG
jgi:hypothetical protein